MSERSICRFDSLLDPETATGDDFAGAAAEAEATTGDGFEAAASNGCL